MPARLRELSVHDVSEAAEAKGRGGAVGSGTGMSSCSFT